MKDHDHVLDFGDKFFFFNLIKSGESLIIGFCGCTSTGGSEVILIIPAEVDGFNIVG